MRQQNTYISEDTEQSTPLNIIISRESETIGFYTTSPNCIAEFSTEEAVSLMKDVINSIEGKKDKQRF